MSVILPGILSEGFSQGFNSNLVGTANISHVSDIRILDSSGFGVILPIIWYGDTVMMGQLGSLLLPIGSGKGISPLLLNSSYIYTFNFTHRMFVIQDTDGNTILKKTNIRSWADLAISKAIIESHQFRIIFTGATDVSSFFIVVYLLKKLGHASTEQFLWGEFDRYIKSVYHFDLSKRLANGSTYYDVGRDIVRNITVEEIINAVSAKLSNISFKINYPQIYIAEDNLIVNDVKKIKQGFINNMTNLIVLAIITDLLYPHLQPILRNEETMNNRPVYEPWMIWYIMTNFFIFPDDEGQDPHNPGDDEGNDPNVIGLSPNWG
ncbi:hypothetical protein [Anaerosinus massiliensis]|uniref:hypothetical protein n=1 Tax=Massilibacillus massiliensis TaxID=1806837 RepID=UPI000DA62BB9|nr:hypothetical protein [Massilibacillus massiliensis]